MKILVRFLIIAIITHFLSQWITSQFFIKGNWSFTLANLAVWLVAFEAVGRVLTWAFATKVADLHFQGKKIGTMSEEDKE